MNCQDRIHLEYLENLKILNVVITFKSLLK